MPDRRLRCWSLRNAALLGAAAGILDALYRWIAYARSPFASADAALIALGGVTLRVLAIVAIAMVLNVFVWRGVDWLARNYHELPPRKEKR